MRKYNGGYIMLDLEDGKVYDQAKKCVQTEKPILVYSENNLPVFAHSISESSGTITLVTPIDTYTITDEGVTVVEPEPEPAGE